jgi:hypothetical protein
VESEVTYEVPVLSEWLKGSSHEGRKDPHLKEKGMPQVPSKIQHNGNGHKPKRKTRYVGSTGKAQVETNNPRWTSKHNVKPVEVAGTLPYDVRYQCDPDSKWEGYYMTEWRKLRGK